MGEMYDLACKMALIAKQEQKGVCLVVRKDGSMQMTMTDPEPFPERETE